MTTQYRDVVGHPGYRVGNDGTIWSSRNNRWGITNTWKQLAPRLKRDANYKRLHVCLGRGVQRHVHTLVLEAFVGPRPDGMFGCHKDGDGTNNKLSNLYWGTWAQNMLDMRKHGRHFNFGNTNACKLTRELASSMRFDRARGLKQKDLATKYGVSQATVSDVLLNKSWP